MIRDKLLFTTLMMLATHVPASAQYHYGQPYRQGPAIMQVNPSMNNRPSDSYQLPAPATPKPPRRLRPHYFGKLNTYDNRRTYPRQRGDWNRPGRMLPDYQPSGNWNRPRFFNGEQ